MLENEREFKNSIEEMRQQQIVLKNQIEQIEEEKRELQEENQTLSSRDSKRVDEAWRAFVSAQRYSPFTPAFGI